MTLFPAAKGRSSVQMLDQKGPSRWRPWKVAPEGRTPVRLRKRALTLAAAMPSDRKMGSNVWLAVTSAQVPAGSATPASVQEATATEAPDDSTLASSEGAAAAGGKVWLLGCVCCRKLLL